MAQTSTLKAEERADEGQERARIKRERDQLNLNLAQQREACYQKLAVTPCLNDARDTHNEKMRDLKRQEVALNDMQRKRAAADRVKALDERNSPQSQLMRAQERGKAMEAAARREESQSLRQKSQEARLAAAANLNRQVSPKKSAKAGVQALAEPKGKPREQPISKAAPDQQVAHAQRVGKRAQHSAQQTAKREQDAKLRREKAADREARRTKPVSPGLPVPR